MSVQTQESLSNSYFCSMYCGSTNVSSLGVIDLVFLMFTSPCQPPSHHSAQTSFHNLVDNSVEDFRRGRLVQQTLLSSTDICYAKFTESENYC